MEGKVRTTAVEALRGLNDGASIAAGGFGVCGVPETLIAAIVQLNARNLTIVSNNVGFDSGRDIAGVAKLIRNHQVSKLISSHVSGSEEVILQSGSGDLHLELTPQGTLAERLRNGGAGVIAFYTKTGVGTVVSEGKEIRQFEGENYVLERAIRTDWAIVKAWRADREGNLQYRRSAQNFNPVCAMAGRRTIAEVDELVENGAIPADQVHTPGIYVHHVVVSKYRKRIEHLTTRPLLCTA